MGKFKKLMEITSNAGYTGDEGEPDTGFIRGDKKRKLGGLSGKPEPWYERGGYEQVDFPKADYIYGKGEEEDYAVIKTAYVSKINDDFEAHFEKWEDWVADKDFDLQNTQELEESTTSTNSPGCIISRTIALSARKGEIKAVRTMMPASAIRRATSAIRRIFSTLSASVNPKSLLSPRRTLSPSRM